MVGQWDHLRSPQQNNLLQSACGDLAAQLVWRSWKLSKNEWRWLISAAILKQKIVPSLDGQGIVALGGSSRDLPKEKFSEAITMAFSIGDAPWEYDETQTKAVCWNPTVRIARGIPDDEA